MTAKAVIRYLLKSSFKLFITFTSEAQDVFESPLDIFTSHTYLFLYVYHKKDFSLTFCQQIRVQYYSGVENVFLLSSRYEYIGVLVISVRAINSNKSIPFYA